MSKKSFIISAAGLKNIVFSKDSEEDSFRFTLGETEISLNRYFADFISPRVSIIHHADPTIDTICLNNFSSKFEKLRELFDPDLVSNIKQIAIGQKIEIDEEMSHKIRAFSVLLGNEEIFDQMNELYPINASEENLDSCLRYLQYFAISEEIGHLSFSFNNQQILDFVSSHFYLIDESKLLNLPKSVIYSIITNDHLKVKNEDCLFDFLKKLFSIENDRPSISIEFFEALNILALSKEKFNEFIDLVDPNEISQSLWQNLKNCIIINFEQNLESKNERYTENKKVVTIKFDGNSNNRFKGIIFHLGNGNPKSVTHNDILTVSSSSKHSGSPDNTVDFDHDSNSFLTHNKLDSWLLYDFRDRKVKLSGYSIKSHHWGGKGSYHPQNWCIEGSNDNENWMILDSRKDEKSLDEKNVSNTFTIQKQMDSTDYYKYLKIRQTGPSTDNEYNFGFSSLEFFGSILEP